MIHVQHKPFSDFEALSHVSQDGHLDVIQLGAGTMTGKLTHIRLNDDMALSSGDFSRGLRSEGVLSNTRICLGSLLESNTTGVHGYRRKFFPGELTMALPGAERYACFPGSTRFFATLITPSALQRFLNHHPGAYEAMHKLEKASIMVTNPNTHQPTAKLLGQLMDGLTDYGTVMPDHVVEFQTRNILNILTMPLHATAEKYNDTGGITNECLVREVDHYTNNRLVHVSELCERFGVTSRKLTRAFHEITGLPPIKFDYRKRLSRVHATLRMGDPATKINEVAITHGFLDLGRFSINYRRLFGERPSETLRRGIGIATASSRYMCYAVIAAALTGCRAGDGMKLASLLVVP